MNEKEKGNTFYAWWYDLDDEGNVVERGVELYEAGSLDEAVDIALDKHRLHNGKATARGRIVWCPSCGHIVVTTRGGHRC